MFKHHLEFIPRNTKPQFICRIDDKNDTLTLAVVAFPERPVLALATHIKTRKGNVLPGERFDLKADCGCYVFAFDFLWFQVVNQSRLA